MQISQADSPEIPEDDPFKNDELEREPVADFLTSMLTTIEEPFVMSLTAPWGTGKTTFIEMWQQKLENEHPSLYFNAWDNDFVDDPLVAFVGEIDERISDQTGYDVPGRLKELGARLARRSVPVALRLVSAGLIDNETGQAAFGDELAEGAEDLFESYLQEKELVSDFRNELEDFADQITEEKEGPLFFFVDELDRCRPDFALELLERIKHLFDVPGIVFILVVDPDQLRHSVKSLYGRGMDARGYLRRFVNLEYELPEPKPGKFAVFLFNAHGFDDLIRRQSAFRMLDVAMWTSEYFDFSLRAQKQYFMRLELVTRVVLKRSDWPDVPWQFLALLIALRKGAPELYRDLRSEKEKRSKVKELANRFKRRPSELHAPVPETADAGMLAAALKVAYWTDRDDYEAYREDVNEKRQEVQDQDESFFTHPKKKEMDRVSYYYNDLGLNFEQELIDLIELTNPAA
jgi:hypothetical protein